MSRCYIFNLLPKITSQAIRHKYILRHGYDFKHEALCFGIFKHALLYWWLISICMHSIYSIISTPVIILLMFWQLFIRLYLNFGSETSSMNARPKRLLPVAFNLLVWFASCFNTVDYYLHTVDYYILRDTLHNYIQKVFGISGLAASYNKRF